ncbi:MAG: hypothetical protein NUW23_11470, partial [Firmicutes bacterium]|nr:hypothetical protein [Bacillota bacterium]
NPDLFNFITNASLKSTDALKDQIEAKKADFLSRAYARFFSGLDLSKFKDGIDPKQALNVIAWTMEGYASRATAKYVDGQLKDLDFSAYMEELDSYLSLLKNNLYK